MKINLIGIESVKHFQTDIETIRFITKKCKDKIDIECVNGNHYKCPNASINFFINTLNPSFFKNAKTNIILLDPSQFSIHLLPFLKDVDVILVKTLYSLDVLKTILIQKKIYTAEECNEKIHYISWRSPNLSNSNGNDKDFSKVLLYCDNRDTDIYMNCVKKWKAEWPTLCIVNGNINVDLAGRNRQIKYNNVIFHDDIQNEQFHLLFNSVGYHLCLDDSNCFDHMVHQCKLIGSIPIACKSSGRIELLCRDWCFILGGKRKKNKSHTLGSTCTTNLHSIFDVMDEIIKLSPGTIMSMAKTSKQNSMVFQKKADDLIVKHLGQIIKETRNKKKIIYKDLDDDECPFITIVTTTRDNRQTFPLAIFNYNSFNYPKHKLEWIIVEDTETEDKKIETLLPDTSNRSKYNIKYVYSDAHKSISEKRNIALEHKSTQSEYIMLMNDNDYFYTDTLRSRMKEFIGLKNKYPYKQIMGFNKLGNFDVSNYLSWIQISPENVPLSNNVNAGALIFSVDLIDKQELFTNDNNSNGLNYLFDGKEYLYVEQCWENNFVRIINKNSNIKAPKNQKSNGCHFGFSEKLYDFILELFNGKKKELPMNMVQNNLKEKDEKYEKETVQTI